MKFQCFGAERIEVFASFFKKKRLPFFCARPPRHPRAQDVLF
jgi:hypothetical protein